MQITLISFAVSVLISLLTSGVLPKANVVVAILLLIAFVLIGILFDIVGIAVTAGNEAPFHAMATKRVKGAKNAVFLIRNAEKVSNVCNDVVGDVAGIVSGATTALVVAELAQAYGLNSVYLSLMLTGSVAALTIGGKGFGKSIAIGYPNKIIFIVARIMCLFSKPFGKEGK